MKMLVDLSTYEIRPHFINGVIDDLMYCNVINDVIDDLMYCNVINDVINESRNNHFTSRLNFIFVQILDPRVDLQRLSEDDEEDVFGSSVRADSDLVFHALY